MYSTILLAALALASTLTVSAGPNHRNTPRRRHHARDSFKKIIRERLGTPEERDSTEILASRDSCNNGDWQCVGSELQRCNFDTWISIQNCTGENVVCSADSKATGCVWSWSIDEPTDVPVTVSAIPSVSMTASSVGSAVTKSSATNGSDDQSASSSASSGSSPSNVAGIRESNGVITSSTTAAPSPSASLVVGNLLAGGNGDNTSSSTRGRKHRSSTQDWYGASTSAQDWSASSSTKDWSASSSTKDWSASSSTDAWAEASSAAWSPSTSQGWYATAYPTTVSTNGNAPSSSAKHGKGSATASSLGSAPTDGGNTGPSGSFSAPHYVIYADEWLNTMPSATDLSSYNRFILAFWMAQRGAVDNAQAWEGFDASYRQTILDQYHEAGIALMVSAFGSTDSPTTNGVDPTQCAQELAAWVKQYDLDGVDIDYEDMNAMNNDQAEAWLITFQTELRQQLPAPYLISHAPVAPWFTSNNKYPSGAYVDIHRQTGSGIDFYNIQFYNQGSGIYEDCDSLIDNSGDSWPDTSVMQINSYAKVPLDKIVIGKPLDAGAASNGFVAGSMLATCVGQAKAQGWNGGVMFWEWSPSIGNSLMATVRG